ncbi:hypothetical protein BU17DRAFT_63816 [Hysterangium stoloniferum]|nr:hypothetical protein BU17DRAFT_63816 [Hysterangium stoloniferum]
MVPGIISISTWIFTGNISNARLLSVILHRHISDTQFMVLDMWTDMSISHGYQLPGFKRGFSPFLAAIIGFKLFTHLDLNLEQAAGLFDWLPFVTAMYSLATVLMSKPFGGRPSCVMHLPHVLHVHIEGMICRELKQQ